MFFFLGVGNVDDGMDASIYMTRSVERCNRGRKNEGVSEAVG